ncbi:MAG TPA: hypothetical protein VM925_22695 [Labilithrix sp.]|nr:hypothetical protein [Labilithrix sp.]
MDGTLVCWGDINAYGDFYGSPTPSGSFLQFDAGSFHACAIRASDHTATCWGSTPADGRAAPGPSTYREVSVAINFGCGIGTDGRITCWPSGSLPGVF